jgi:hypothetical protein
MKSEPGCRRKRAGECVPTELLPRAVDSSNRQVRRGTEGRDCRAGLEDLEIELLEVISGHLPDAVDQFSLWATCRRTVTARHPTELTIRNEEGECADSSIRLTLPTCRPECCTCVQT